MKRVALLRHAKAARPPGTDDFDRPLEERGRKDAAAMAAIVGASGVDFIACSPAQRTRETLEAILAALPPTDVCYDEELYGASVDDLLLRLAALPDHRASALFIGHNPGLQSLALHLADSKRSDRKLYRRLEENFPTAAFAQFVFEADGWSGAAAGTGRLVAYMTPKRLHAQ